MSEYCTFIIRQGHPDGHYNLTKNYYYHNRMLSANIVLTYERLRQYINSIVPLLGLTNVAHQKVTISLV